MFCESSRKWISDNVRRERKTLHHESVFNFSHHVLDCHKPLDFIPKTLYADNFHTGAMCSTMGSVLFLFRAFWLDYIPKSSLNPWSHAKLHKQWGLTTGCRERGGGAKLSQFLLVLILNLRKTFLHLSCYGAHLRGIGGAGAPHVFAFDRFEDLGWLFLSTVFRMRRMILILTFQHNSKVF